MNSKVLKMTVLVLALLVVSGLRASHMPAALAEKDVKVGHTGTLEIGRADMWNNSFADVVAELDAAEIIVSKDEVNGNNYQVITADDIAVSDYVADEMTFLYHGDNLCTYFYEFTDRCSEENFSYLVDALNTKYGTAVKKGFSFKNMSNCSMFGVMQDLYDAVRAKEDKDMGLLESATRTVTNLLVAMPTEMYEWYVGDHTKISMYYCHANSFMAKDNFFIVYSNQLGHEALNLIVEPKKEYNVDGL